VRVGESYGVCSEKHLPIISSVTTRGYEALLYVEGRGRVVARGFGPNHYEAMWELQKEVGVREHEREMERCEKQ
jgi:hypothetical protein